MEQNEVFSNNKILDEFKYLNDSITLFKMQLTTLQQHVKILEKNVTKEIKNCNKYNNKLQNMAKEKTKKEPSGFAKPTKISKELCEFMNIPEGSEIARTEVTKFLVQYIKEKNLQEQTNKSKNKIIPDDKLRDLLGINENNDLTYFNMQKYMNKHFIF